VRHSSPLLFHLARRWRPCLLLPVLDWTLVKGVKAQVEAFRAGFSTIFPVGDLRAFSPHELVVLFGSADEDWSAETLAEVLKADHGYNQESGSIANLIEVMAAYDAEERREYLQFVTGAPKLPIGGASCLDPRPSFLYLTRALINPR
jgi:E3 ubiquitin-protein ligase TRIP12